MISSLRIRVLHNVTVRLIADNASTFAETVIVQPDSDGDGVNDNEDTCPFTPNAGAGQTEDTNTDGTPDACENALSGVSDLRGIPGDGQVELRWTNPAGSIELLNISWWETSNRSESLDFAEDTEQVISGDDMASYTVSGLENGRNYTARVDVHVANGDVFQSEEVNVPVGINTDGDDLPNYLDADDDNDGINDTTAAGDPLDNCPLVENPEQHNNDTDEFGDACDEDDDGDGVNEVGPNGRRLDNCQFLPNPLQHNNDTDEFGDACDEDDDGDGVNEVGPNGQMLDNCRFVANPLQHNNDTDQFGDACDEDDDGDDVNEVGPNGQPLDNCLFVKNPEQHNNDTDEFGDACDEDDDGDGVNDVDPNGRRLDNCRVTPNSDQRDANQDSEGDACDTIADRPAASGVSGLTAAGSRDRIRLNWTNPPGFITAFNISWHEVGDTTMSGFEMLDEFTEERNTNSETVTAHIISSLRLGVEYRVTVRLIADDRNDFAETVVATVVVPPDSDGDGVGDDPDNCPAVANPLQINTDELLPNGDTLGDACDDDDDADGFLEVGTEAQLAAIRSNLTGHYELHTNITLSTSAANSWQPIGNGTNPFRGKFNGNGHVISDLYSFIIETPDPKISVEAYSGLFGYISGAEVKNLGIVAHNITAAVLEGDGNVYAGVLAGRSLNSSISNVHVNLLGAINAHVNHILGGIGTSNPTDTNVFDTNSFAGGLVGQSLDSNIWDSDAVISDHVSALSERVEDFKDYSAAAGGLVGWNRGVVRNSYAVVGVGVFARGSYRDLGNNQKERRATAGGLVGRNLGQIDSAYANCIWRGFGPFCGGIRR